MARFIQLTSGAMLLVAIFGLAFLNLSVVANWDYRLILHHIRQEGFFVPGGPFGVVGIFSLAGIYLVSFISPKA